MRLIIILILLLSVLMRGNAQQKILTENELISVIAKFHPVARQAAIDVRIARAEVLSSRGGFDPQLTGESARKEFGGLTYYDHQISELRVPTWYGIDLYAGTESITGGRVNPEETQGSITYMGFSIQPIRNLLMDRRRAALLLAKNYEQLSEVQRRIVVNDLLQDALFSYWDWWEKYHVQQVIKAALLNAEKRLTFVKTAFELGDRPAIDTLEAYTQVQDFQIRLSEVYQDLVKANLYLSGFLWAENGAQIELPPDVVPQDSLKNRAISLAEVLNSVDTHPELTQYQFKLRELQIEKKLAFQSLLPDVRIKYNQMGYDLSKTVNAPWFNNNYRFGASLSVPLRLSEGRGDYQKARLGIESTRLEQANKEVQLDIKVKQYFTEWQQTETQLSLQTGLLANTRALQRGEEVKFSNGESSLFLINARVQKTLEVEQKAIQLKAKAQKAGIGVRWSAGILVQ